ncbi:hypothetical protein FOF52_15325 [Thermobifida alba]|uniref:Uncharacterized protein n=1 Tax=Thermobifida alba TaxID=53522 RepID=A0ABY4L475_THEAE|nr:hypothetical protein [Thermobifida alba]UPT22164.1 hypothetical protein FOF52_15325 [Thermobifida alba]
MNWTLRALSGRVSRLPRDLFQRAGEPGDTTGAPERSECAYRRDRPEEPADRR